MNDRVIVITGIFAFILIFVAIGTTSALAPRNNSVNTTSTVFESNPINMFLVNASHYSMNLSVPSGQSLLLLSPYYVNFPNASQKTLNSTTLSVEVVSLTPISQYSASQILNISPIVNQTQYLFIPLNGTTANSFILHANATAMRGNLSLPNYILIETNNPARAIPLTALKNITSIGTITLNLNISTTYSRPAGEWNLLFGSTGVGNNISVTALDAQAFFAILSGVLLGLGFWRKSKWAKGIGFFLGAILIFTLIGLVPILVGLGVYLLGWFLISMIWRYRRQPKKGSAP